MKMKRLYKRNEIYLKRDGRIADHMNEYVDLSYGLVSDFIISFERSHLEMMMGLTGIGSEIHS